MLSYLPQHEGLLPLWLLLVYVLAVGLNNNANVGAGVGDLCGKYDSSLLEY